MPRQNRRRGGALLEFAVALPFALTLFLGITDFTVYFWHQIEMEEAARSIAGKVTAAPYATVPVLRVLSQPLQEEAGKQFHIEGLNVELTRHYACPLPSGAEQNLTGKPQLCDGERVYIRVACDRAVSPLFAPLRLLGYPRKAFSRHVVRIR